MIFSRMMTKEHRCFLLFNLMVGFLMTMAVPATLLAVDQVASNQFSPDVNTTVGPDLFTGSLTTSIPIAVPPGRGGMAPALNLTYNSRGENGWLGVGWQLEVGSIERNTRKGADYANNFGDDYVLNLNGVEGELVNIASGEYRLKIEGSFLRVRKLIDDYGRDSWEVTDKLGTRYLFGREQSSRQDNHYNIDQIFSWCLDEVIDVHGNFMTFTYVKDQGQIYLSQIDYTGHRDQSGQVTLAPTHSVRFFLEDRDDPWTSFAPRWSSDAYSSPFGVRTAKQLRTVAVYADNQVHAAYAFHHDPSNSTKRSLFSSVTRYGSDAFVNPDTGAITSDTALPSQYFTYSQDEHTFASQSNGPNLKVASDPAWAAIDLMRVRYGDFNGDGRTDILRIPGEGGSAPLEIHLSNGVGFNSPILGPSLSVAGEIEEANVDLARVKLGDFNGDGRTDLAIVEGLSSSARLKIYYANSVGSGFNVPVDGPLIPLGDTSVRRQIDLDRIKLGDFNGDGKTDILKVNGWGSTQAASFIYHAAASGSGFDALYSGPSFAVAGTEADAQVDLARFQVADFDGNSTSDLLYVNATGQVKTYFSTPNGMVTTGITGPQLSIRTDPALALVDLGRLLLGDFNGDGLADLGYIDGLDAWLPIKIYFSKGATFSAGSNGPVAYVASSAQGGQIDVARVGAGDFNGDGKTDIYRTALYNYIYHSTGDGFFNAPNGPTFFLDPDPPKTLNDLGRIRVGDFNGDGKIDLSRIEGSSGTLTPLRINLAAGPFADLLTSMSNGIGGGQLITYQSSTSVSNINLPNPLQIVSSVTACDNFNLDVNGVGQCSGKSFFTSYEYAGGYYHSGERDFRGFSWAKVVEPAGMGGRLIHETWFHQGNDVAVGQNNPNVSQGYMKGRPYRTKTIDGYGNLLTETTTTYQPDADGLAPYFNPVSQVQSDLVDPEGLSSIRQTKTTAYQYDAYGNVRQEEVTGSGGGSENFVTLREFAATNIAAWLVGLPTRATVKESVAATDKLAETVYCYDGAACSIEMTVQPAPTVGDLTATVRWHSTDADPKTEMGYDSFGNLLWQKDANNNISRIAYDATNTFPTETINPLGQKTVSQFYGVDGVAADQGLYGQLKDVTYPDMALSGDYTLGEVKSVDHNWKKVTLLQPYTAPVVIAGPPSNTDPSPGVLQLKSVTTTSFYRRFQEWNYLTPPEGGTHGLEIASCLVLEKGRTTLPDGTIMEVGTFSLSGTGSFQTQSFTDSFPGRPAIFLTVQTANDSTPVTVRANNVTTLGFDTALFEEENLMGSGHVAETVGYLAIYTPNPAKTGIISFAGVDVPYQIILNKQVNETLSSVNSYFKVMLQEETSLDAETTHGYEAVDILLVGKQFFAQSTSFNNADTFALRNTELSTNGDGLSNLSKYSGTTDISPASVTIEYDVFGRKSRESRSDGFWTSWSYNNLGVVGSQHLRTDNSAGLWSATYFNGLGKTTQEQKIGADSKVIVSDTTYDGRGQVYQQTLPYFQGEGVNRISYTYEALGRVKTVTYPDLSKTSACYNRDVSVTVDQSGHKRRETRDVHGRLTKVEEYDGTFAGCSNAYVGTPYATTIYQYDRLGNLTSVTDAQNNVTTMTYDTLGRKSTMTAPDMGTWSYLYDANGNLTRQTDAKGQIINFQYDALNRLTRKDYPAGTDTYFIYDEAFTHGHGIGRLTTMRDASGVTSYYYADPFGKSGQENRSIDGITYVIKTSSDALGRLASVTYPDGENVAYTYDTGGNLSQAVGYLTISGYNALGQPAQEDYGNGTTNTYGYQPLTNRLSSLRVYNGSQYVLQLDHGYDLGGNPTAITNTLDPTKSQTFQYDGLNRLKQAQSTAYGTLTYTYDKIGNFSMKEGFIHNQSASKPHAVQSITTPGYYRPGQFGNGTYIPPQIVATFDYDYNGNMTYNSSRGTMVWDYDNHLSSVTAGAVTTNFVYDGMGNRVKKVGPAGTTIYVGKLYEISGGVPVKYIYANGQRIALKSPTQTLYYHGNHLGSTSLVTDSARNVVETLFYKPFGDAFTDTGSVSMNHKYTGQELDPETGLYYYNARYYNPYMGKFLSADTIVPNPTNPQSLNRYSYVLNNPLIYTDPTGHFSIKKAIKFAKAAKKMMGVIEIAWGGALVSTGDPTIGSVGLALIGHGVTQLGGTASGTPPQIPIVTYGGSGSSSGGANGGDGIEYVGPGSGNNAPNPGYVPPNPNVSSGTVGISGRGGSSGGNGIVLVLEADYSYSVISGPSSGSGGMPSSSSSSPVATGGSVASSPISGVGGRVADGIGTAFGTLTGSAFNDFNRNAPGWVKAYAYGSAGVTLGYAAAPGAKVALTVGFSSLMTPQGQQALLDFAGGFVPGPPTPTPAGYFGGGVSALYDLLNE